MNLLRNSIFNMAGGLLPAAAALVTVPIVVSRLGADQYGLFTIVTTIVGYFAVFDINVTAGAVKYVAEHHARAEHEQANEVISFGALIYLIIGAIGALGIVAFADGLVRHVFNVPAALHDEGVRALYWAAPGFLLGQVQSYLLSIPQALQRYDVSARFEAAFGIIVSLATVAVVLAGGGLAAIMAARALLSLINGALLIRAIRALYPQIGWRRPARKMMQAIASFSAYSYLSRLAAITFLNADKLLIGALRDMKALSLYTVPFLLVNRVFGLVTRLAAVMFPATSALAAQGRLDELRETYLTSSRYIAYLNACLATLLLVSARETLHYWVGPLFGAEAALVLALLALALFVDSLTQLPSLVNDGLGTPRNTGIFAVVRAALGLGLGYLAIKAGGIVGAAIAQLAISIVLTLAFVISIHRLHRATLRTGFGEVLLTAWVPAFLLPGAIGLTSLFWIARAPLSLLATAALLLLVGGVLAFWGWIGVLRPADRQRCSRWLLSRTRPSTESNS